MDGHVPEDKRVGTCKRTTGKKNRTGSKKRTGGNNRQTEGNGMQVEGNSMRTKEWGPDEGNGGRMGRDVRVDIGECEVDPRER